MKKISLDHDWKFSYSTGNGYQDQQGQAYKKTVTLPHDFMISTKRSPESRAEGAGGYFQGGSGIYEKELVLTSEQEGHQFILMIEGSYGFTEVWINANLAAQHPYGYTEYHVDLTKYLRFGETNKLKIVVNNNALPNSRWYSGSGLYRHVSLWEGEAVFLDPWSVAVQTPDLEHVNMVVEVTNTGKENKEELLVEILSPEGECVSIAKKVMNLKPGKNPIFLSIFLKDAKIWSLEQPNLYTANITVGKDFHRVDFGIRTILIDRETGFSLNGRPLKLKGGCIHHDNGIVGACAYEEFEERKIRLLKSAGYNAIRCSHNPMSSALLDACDRLGMLVMEESFDCWNMKKNSYDYHLFFHDWWQKDLEAMILRDRNHPSVVFYSVGNEIGERDGSSNAEEWSKKLCDYARKLDPTRVITNGVCMVFLDAGEFGGILANIFGSGEPIDFPSLPENVKGFLKQSEEVTKRWGEITEPFIRPLDVAGYNYLDQRYEEDGLTYPTRIIVGTESYPKAMNSVWKRTMEHAYVLGDFTWTAWDYLGESGIGHALYGEHGGLFMEYPWHTGNCGDFDICGFLRPQGQARKLLWNVSNKPVIAVLKPEHTGKEEAISSWGWEDVIESYTFPEYVGKELRVSIYSNADEVVLSVNGTIIGRETVPENGIVHKNIVYEPGKIEAINYRNGVAVEASELFTVGEPDHLAIFLENEGDRAVNGIRIYRIEVQDKENNRIPWAEHLLQVEVEGGSLLGFGNARPNGQDFYTEPSCHAWEGRALLAVINHTAISVQTKGLPVLKYSEKLFI